MGKYFNEILCIIQKFPLIQENALENVVCEMAAISSRTQIVKCQDIWFQSERLAFKLLTLVL